MQDSPQPASVPPVDLEIRITMRSIDGKIHIEYDFHSPGGAVAEFHHRNFLIGPLHRDPQEYQTLLRHMVEKWHAGLDISNTHLLGEEITEELEGLGRELYQDLWSPEMKVSYRRVRERVTTLQITTDEPWVPWELVKPYDDSDPQAIIDDDFLCGRFQLTRWLAGEHTAPGRITVASLACIDVGGGQPRSAAHRIGAGMACRPGPAPRP